MLIFIQLFDLTLFIYFHHKICCIFKLFVYTLQDSQSRLRLERWLGRLSAILVHSTRRSLDYLSMPRPTLAQNVQAASWSRPHSQASYHGNSV